MHDILGIFMSSTLCKKKEQTNTTLFTLEMCIEMHLSENDYVPAVFKMKCDEYSI